MNTKKLLQSSVAALCMALALGSCSWDDENQTTLTIDMLALVQYDGGADSAWFLLDDFGTKCWPANASALKPKPAGGARLYVVAQYTNTEVKPGYDMVLQLVSVRTVAVTDVTPTDSITIATYDDAKLQKLSYAWVSSRFLNVDYQFTYGDTEDAAATHTLALLCDSTARNSSPLTLRLVHNRNGDAGTSSVARSIASFDLESLRGIVAADSVVISFEAYEEYKSVPPVRMGYKFEEQK